MEEQLTSRWPEENHASAESLEHLGFYTRTKESTIGAIKNVFEGIGQIIFAKEKRWQGATKIAEGVFNTFDILPSAAADTLRAVVGPKKQYGPSLFNYNFSRAAGSVSDIDVKNPLEAIGAAGDIVHAIGTRIATDIARLSRSEANYQVAA